MWVPVSVSELGWGGAKSHSYRLLCLLSPSLLSSDLASLISRDDFRELHPNDSGIQEKKRDVIREVCSKILQWQNSQLKAQMETRIFRVARVFGKAESGRRVMAVRVH